MKHILENLATKFIEEFFRFIFMLIIYWCTNLFTEKDLYTNLKGSLAIIIPYFIYILFMVIISFVQKPIIVNIKMSNYLFDDREETDLLHYKSFREDSRKIILDLSIIENNSLWTKLALYIFKNKKFTIKIQLDPLIDEFVCQPCEQSSNIKFEGSYFTIDISQIILCRLNRGIPTSQKYYFIIGENRDNPPSIDGEYHIKPSFLIDEREPNFLQTQLIKCSLNMKKKYYIVNYKK